MSNKGFTLVELIAVLLILAVILLICFPNLQSLGGSEKERQYSQMVESLCLAGQSYINSKVDSYNNLEDVGSTIVISINELISYGNVDEKLKNPKTKKLVRNDRLTYTILSDYTLSCEYSDN